MSGLIGFERTDAGNRRLRATPPSTGDLVAGVSVALVAIPQCLAYAQIAGMPPPYGLYATALPALVAAFFVSSKYLETGAVALTALLTFGSLSEIAEPFSARYIELAALLAVMVGLVRLGLGIVKLGRLAYLLSEPVLLGFTTAAAVLIVLSQVPKVFDTGAEGGVVGAAADAIGDVGNWSFGSLAFASATAAIIMVGRRVHRLFPGVLVAVAVAIPLSVALDFSGSTVGELEGGFLSLRFTFPWGEVGALLVPAVVIALVGFAEPASIARTFAIEEHLDWNADQEMISQGVANLTSGFSGAFPVGGSFSRSSLNRMAGADSAWAGAITGLIVLFALPFTPLIEPLPTAVLGAIVIVSVMSLIKFGDIVRVARQSRYQGVVTVGTFVVTLATAPRVQNGVLIGIGLSLFVHLLRETNVSVGSRRNGDTLVLRPEGTLWFATVPAIEAAVRREVNAHSDVQRIVFVMAGVGRLDFSGGASLARLTTELEEQGYRVEVREAGTGARRSVGVHLQSNVVEADDQR